MIAAVLSAVFAGTPKEVLDLLVQQRQKEDMQMAIDVNKIGAFGVSFSRGMDQSWVKRGVQTTTADPAAACPNHMVFPKHDF